MLTESIYNNLLLAFKGNFNEKSKSYYRIQQILYEELMTHKEPTYEYKDLDELYYHFYELFGINFQKTKSGNREQNKVAVRHFFFYQARIVFGNRYTLVNLGKFLKLDHTSVIHALNSVKTKLILNDHLITDVANKWNEYNTNRKIKKQLN